MSWYHNKAMIWSRGGKGRVLKNVEHSYTIQFFGLEEKWALQRRNIFIQIWKYLPRAINFKPKFEFQTLLGANMSCWNLGIIFLLEPTLILLGLDIPGYSFEKSIFVSPNYGLLDFLFLRELYQSPKGKDCLRSPWLSRQLRIYKT